ncbi:MAG: CHAD domain-containing protein, partial [Planctomycetota bacterium]
MEKLDVLSPGGPEPLPPAGDAIPVDRWLDHFVRQVLFAREQPGGVHQLRVTAARLRVWLEMSGLRVLSDDVRWIRRAAAPVRDLDALLAGEWPEEFAQWLREERTRQRWGFLTALDGGRLKGLTLALALLPPVPRETARTALRDYAARV